MPSPFPGMDPYLEGPLWPDVHQALASRVRDRLAPLLRPRYVARLTVRAVKDAEADAEIGIAYPDVGVFRRGDEPGDRATASIPGITPATLTIPSYVVEVRLVSVEVRDVDTNRLVTAIEILSPVNKRGRGLREYRKKRQAMRLAGVHLLEIDLLRRGTRVVPGSRVPPCHYLVSLARSGTGATELWTIALRDRLPVVPVPLDGNDEDIPLDLKSLLDELYDAASYDLSIDYDAPPPPPDLSPEDAGWARSLIPS